MAQEIVEESAVGKVENTYILSRSSEGVDRIDRVNSPEKVTWWEATLAVFLPVGYPQSVSDDYTQYQIYDSLQAFASSIAGLLSSRAVLQGVGVGDATASPTAALLLSVLQESMGRLATIMFAHRLGSALEPECKMYRLMADVFNDVAMILDCLSPVFPRPLRVLILSFSSVLRALCGVAAGSSKASLSAHFALRDNLGELNAKDSSQETVISLLGMLAGSLVVSQIEAPLSTWSLLILLLSVHLAMNYLAVSAVTLSTLNRQRANIVLSRALDGQKAPLPEQVSKEERIFEWDGVLRWRDSKILGQVAFVRFDQFLTRLGPATKANRTTGATHDSDQVLSKLMLTLADEDFLIWWDASRLSGSIVLKASATSRSTLKAWAMAMLLAHEPIPKSESTPQQTKFKKSTDVMITTIRQQLIVLNGRWEDCLAQIERAGFNLDLNGLETTPSTRIRLRSE